MKPILSLVLLFASVTLFAKASGKSEPRFIRIAAIGFTVPVDAVQARMDGFAAKRSLRQSNQKRVWVGFMAARQQNRNVKQQLTFAARQRGPVGEALSHVYVKNGAAGFMGGWVNNVQLTFGWRYQPFRVLGSERPVPVHPLMMRVRVRI